MSEPKDVFENIADGLVIWLSRAKNAELNAGDRDTVAQYLRRELTPAVGDKLSVEGLALLFKVASETALSQANATPEQQERAEHLATAEAFRRALLYIKAVRNFDNEKYARFCA